MAAIDDDDRPKKKITHEIGQDLTLLSVMELNARIGLLREEITRLETDVQKKQVSRSAALTLLTSRKTADSPRWRRKRAW